MKKFVVVFNDTLGYMGILKEGHEEPHNQNDYLKEDDYLELFGVDFDSILEFDSRSNNEETLKMIRKKCPQFEFEDYIIV